MPIANQRDPQLRLQRGHMAPKGVEGLLHLGAVEALACPRDILDARERRQRRPVLRPPWFSARHLAYASTPPCGTGVAKEYDRIIGRKGSLP